MTNCVNCGTFIDTANPRAVFYTVKSSVYECGECHNADLNKPAPFINVAEAIVLVITVITIVAIYYLVL